MNLQQLSVSYIYECIRKIPRLEVLFGPLYKQAISTVIIQQQTNSTQPLFRGQGATTFMVKAIKKHFFKVMS